MTFSQFVFTGERLQMFDISISFNLIETISFSGNEYELEVRKYVKI